MSFVIYNLRSKHLYNARTGSHFKERVAKAVFTKAVKAGKINASEWKVASADEWRNADVMVEVKNLLSGKPVMIRASERGGCCDPSTERYHCM